MDTYIPCFAQEVFLLMSIGLVLMLGPNNITSFRINLYQRDSYGSPFYNPKLSETEVIHQAIARSLNKSYMITPNNIKADILRHAGNYLMKICLGTPPIEIIAVVDTGSDFTWTQCQPCTRCVPQRMPFFYPRASSSYAKIPCGPLRYCPSRSYSQCQADGFCHHNIRYDDQSYSRGLLSKETMRMDSTISGQIVEIPNYIFGCGLDNDGSFGRIGSGIIGLGIGPQSLITQLGILTMDRFSYCLTRFRAKDRVSHIWFGQDALVEGPEIIRVPLVNKLPSPEYYITLEAFTVASTRIEFTSASGSIEEGNIVIDSGTTLVMLPRRYYDKVRHIVIEKTNAPPMPDPNQKLELCFKKDASLKLPRFVANFRGGDVPLKKYHVFIDLDSLTCLAFGATDERSIYGSWAQQNFIVGYDNRIGTISFKPFDCTNF